VQTSDGETNAVGAWKEEQMAESRLNLGVREAAPGITILDIHGDVTPAAEDALMGAYSRISGTNAVVLNFSELDYMNSGGIGLLVTLLVRAQRQKQRLLAYGLSDHYRQIFELTRLDDAIAIHHDELTALHAVSA
jgi:anti-sigma B factor antagonist